MGKNGIAGLIMVAMGVIIAVLSERYDIAVEAIYLAKLKLLYLYASLHFFDWIMQITQIDETKVVNPFSEKCCLKSDKWFFYRRYDKYMEVAKTRGINERLFIL